MSSSDEYVPTQPQDANRTELTVSAERDNELPHLGGILFDKYRITAKKEGGFGAVLLVTDIFTNQKYAVKTYKPKYSNEEQFKSEVDFWINLDAHPNIVKAYFVEVVNKRPFLFMEYISGSVLRDLIGKLTIDQAVNFAYQICRGMEAANQKRKIVHSDLKPENVLITQEGTAKVTDFGLAKNFNFYGDNFPYESAGTLPYMPPEQLHGEVLDEKSDIFSYGIMFYEMLSGQLPYPFETKNLDVLQWRKQLDHFYNNMGSTFSADEYRLSPWTKINNQAINEDLKHIVISCIFPKRDNRWPSFAKLRITFEKKFCGLINDYKVTDEATDLYRQALSLHKIGRLDKALSTFNRALQETPDNAYLWRDAAIALLDAGMVPTAKQFVAKALELNPNINVDDPRLDL